MSGLETWVEWRVTGDPGHGFPAYEFVWSRYAGPVEHRQNPEAAARAFVGLMHSEDHTPWVDGPHLSRRTVTRTQWEPVD